MPPSGYTHRQSQSIVDFLLSCSDALKAEAHQKGLTPVEALSNECSNIKNILNSVHVPDIQTSVLQLTFAFYESILKITPSDFHQYDHAVEQVASIVVKSIMDIHVPAELSK